METTLSRRRQSERAEDAPSPPSARRQSAPDLDPSSSARSPFAHARPPRAAVQEQQGPRRRESGVAGVPFAHHRADGGHSPPEQTDGREWDAGFVHGAAISVGASRELRPDARYPELHFDKEMVRAHDVMDFRESTWPREGLREWLADNWARWTAERPAFFTDAWIAKIPADLRPDLAPEVRSA